MQDICYNFNNFDDLTDKDLQDRIHNLGVARDTLRSITAKYSTPKAHAYFQRRLET